MVMKQHLKITFLIHKTKHKQLVEYLERRKKEGYTASEIIRESLSDTAKYRSPVER